jgi:class 3 adenylate cyclase/tetratricopeptide (TPR) repeat protein
MRCSSCGGELPPDSRFCPHCGTQQSVGDQERRVVTVLFADIVGFTSLAETLDPENVKRIVDGCFERLAADIVAFGGVVDKILGDGIVALFGAPIAHEDDPERAVRAGLRMQQTMASLAASSEAPLQLRIGVNTGEVLVGMSSAGGDYTAMGDVMNLAARLEEIAEPGRVLVGPSTHAATLDAISYRPFGEVLARGREEVLDAWVALNPVRPPGTRSRRSVAFVGRERELAAIETQARLAFEGSRAHATMVVGEAGMGKTRIVQEAGARIGAHYDARVIEGRAVPYGEANAWWPVADVLRQVFVLEVDASIEHATFVIDAGLAVHLDEPDDNVRRRYTTALLHALGYGTTLRGGDRDTNRAEVMLAFAALLVAELDRRPVVLIMSDVHLASEGVRLLLEHLLAELGRLPFLLLLTAKALASKAMPPGRYGSMVLPLAPLDDAAASLMLEEFGLDLSEEDERRIVERSGGNPLFLEELAGLVKSRTESAALDPLGALTSTELSSLPGNLRGIIAARLDALDPALRSLLEAAAVFGPNGPLSGLRRMAEVQLGIADIDPLISELVEADLIVISGGRYQFRSDLVRDVAYATLTKSGRAVTHYGIASYLEDLGPSHHRLSIVLTIARHFAAASALVNDLAGGSELDPSEVREKAIYWLNEAGNQSLAGGAPTEAEHWYSLGLDLVDDPETRAGFLYGRARARSDVRDLTGARADLELIATIAEPEALLVARVLLEHGELDRKRGDFDRAVQRLSEASIQLSELGDSEKEALALRLLGLAEMGRGDIGLARRALERSRSIAADSDDPRSEAWALQGLGFAAYRAGDLGGARQLVGESVAIFEELGDAGGMAWARGIEAWVAFHSGEWDRARDLLDRVGPELRRRGDPWAQAAMKNLAASIALWSGDLSTAYRTASEATELAERADDPAMFMQAQGLAGRALVSLGQVDAGRQLLEAGYHAAERNKNADAVRFAVMANAGNAALLGESESAIRWAARFEGEVPDPDMLGETDLAVALALAMLQRGAIDEASSHLKWLQQVPGHSNMYGRSVEAIVAAAGGDLVLARTRAGEVISSHAATYLDTVFAHLALAAVHHQMKDLISCELAIASAKQATAGTDDAVMPLIISMAEAVYGFGNVAHTEIRFRGLGMDPDGWRRAWSLAASGDAAVAV